MKHRTLLETLEALDPNLEDGDAEVGVFNKGIRLTLVRIEVDDAGYRIIVGDADNNKKKEESYHER